MLLVTFYQFAKKKNSTAQPTASPSTTTVFPCNLKAPCSQLQPVLELRLDNSTDTPQWNYCHIPAFSKYYHVTDWTYSQGIWIVSLVEDVLATYKTQIGSTSTYILRSSYSSDGAIQDMLYPQKSTFTQASNSVQMYPPNTVGYYVVGIVGKPTANTEPVGGVTYLVMNPAAFQSFRTQMFKDDIAYVLAGDEDEDIGIADFGRSLLKMMFDPFEYIRSVCWLPAKPAVQTGRLYTLNLGFWSMLITQGFEVYSPTVTPSFPEFPITIPKRTDITRGKYVLCSPFTEYKLYIPTVGYISLDTTKLLDAQTVKIRLFMDPVAQTSYVKVFAGYRNAADDFLLGIYSAGFVSPVQLAQSGVTLGSMVAGAASLGASIGASAAGGDVAGAIGSAGSIVSPSGIFGPSVDTVSTNGGFAWLVDGTAYLYAWFYDLVDDDNSHRGRPLMKVGTPSAYPGFIQASDSHLEIATATREEIDQIEALMLEGFYYE